MAQYTPSFVDTTGFVNAYNQGVINEAKIKQEQDLLVQKDIADFEKNYDPRRLKEEHIPEFTMAFKQYKDAALRYSRLNRGGAKPEEIATASALKDKALANMNSIYSNSTAIANKQAEYAKLIEHRRLNQLTVPDELNTNYAALQTMSATQKPDNVPSAFSINLGGRTPNYKKVLEDIKYYNGGKANVFENSVKGDPVIDVNTGKVMLDANGVPMYKTRVNKYESYSPLAAVKATEANIAIDSALSDEARQEKLQFMDALNAKDSRAVSRYQNMANIFGEEQVDPNNPKNKIKVLPMTSISDAMVWAYKYYNPETPIDSEQNDNAIKLAGEVRREKESKRHNIAMENKTTEPKVKPQNVFVKKTQNIVSSNKAGNYTKEFSAVQLPDPGSIQGFKKQPSNVYYNGRGTWIVDIGNKSYKFSNQEWAERLGVNTSLKENEVPVDGSLNTNGDTLGIR